MASPQGLKQKETNMNRRAFLASLSASFAAAAAKLPANKNIKWAVSAGLWGHFKKVQFTDILDMMRDTGFIGVRLTGFPGILKTYDITAAQMEKECSKRNVHVVEKFQKHKSRLMFMDYKDAKWTTPTEDWKSDNGRVYPKDSSSAKFFNSIYDLGDGEIDFPACHRILKEIKFKGWICVDLDT